MLQAAATGNAHFSRPARPRQHDGEELKQRSESMAYTLLISRAKRML